LLFHCSNGYTSSPQCTFIRKLPVLTQTFAVGDMSKCGCFTPQEITLTASAYKVGRQQNSCFIYFVACVQNAQEAEARFPLLSGHAQRRHYLYGPSVACAGGTQYTTCWVPDIPIKTKLLAAFSPTVHSILLLAGGKRSHEGISVS